MSILRVVTGVLFSLAAALPLAAQTQITTAVIEGDGRRRQRGGAARVSTVEVRNVDTNLARDAGDRSGRPVRRAAAAARTLHRDVQAGRLRHARAGGRHASPSARPSRLSPAMKVSGIAETVTVTHAGADGRHDAHRRRHHARPDHDRDHADPRPQVRGSADAHARRQRRPGTGRRRDHVLRPARRLQQHQPRRRRLQQRLLRRAGGRPARGDRHHARRGQGVPGRSRPAPARSSAAPPAASST